MNDICCTITRATKALDSVSSTIVANPADSEARENVTSVCKGLAVQMKKLQGLADVNMSKDVMTMSEELAEQYRKLYDAALKDTQDSLDTYAEYAEKDKYASKRNFIERSINVDELIVV